MKIFGLVKTEFANYFAETQRRYLDKRESNAERYGFKRFKDRVKFHKRTAKSTVDEDEEDLATEARLEAQKIVFDL